MECLQNLLTIPTNYRSTRFSFKILPNKFPFTNLELPYYNKSRYNSESWESRITQKRFVELFNNYNTPLREISIVSNKVLQFYFIGVGFVFRKDDKYPIIVKCNDGIFVDRNITEFEFKLLKKISEEYIIKDFVMEDLIIHHKFRFKDLKERSEYLGGMMNNLIMKKEELEIVF